MILNLRMKQFLVEDEYDIVKLFLLLKYLLGNMRK